MPGAGVPVFSEPEANKRGSIQSARRAIISFHLSSVIALREMNIGLKR